MKPPFGAVVTYIPEGYKQEQVAGSTLFRYDNICFRPVPVQGMFMYEVGDYLKYAGLNDVSGENKHPSIGVATDSPQPYSFEDANYWGAEFATLKDFHDPQACARLCAENPNCKVASHHDASAQEGWANTCVLRSALGSRRTKQRGITSWVKK